MRRVFARNPPACAAVGSGGLGTGSKSAISMAASARTCRLGTRAMTGAEFVAEDAAAGTTADTAADTATGTTAADGSSTTNDYHMRSRSRTRRTRGCVDCWKRRGVGLFFHPCSQNAIANEPRFHCERMPRPQTWPAPGRQNGVLRQHRLGPSAQPTR